MFRDSDKKKKKKTLIISFMFIIINKTNVMFISHESEPEDMKLVMLWTR